MSDTEQTGKTSSVSSTDLMKEDFRRFMWYVWVKLLLLPVPTRLQYDIAQFLATGPRRRMIQACGPACKRDPVSGVIGV